MFYRNCVFKSFKIFTRKHLFQSLFNKLAGLSLQKRLCYKCFLVNFAKFLRTCFFIEYLWLLLPSRDILQGLNTPPCIAEHLEKASIRFFINLLTIRILCVANNHIPFTFIIKLWYYISQLNIWITHRLKKINILSEWDPAIPPLFLRQEILWFGLTFYVIREK